MEPKKNSLWWVVGIVAIIIVIALVLVGKKAAAPVDETSAVTENQTTGSSAGVKNNGTKPTYPPPSSAMQTNPMTLKQLIASTKNQKCTFVDSGSGTNIQGTVYVSQGKLRADMNVTANSKNTTSHMVTLGQDVYLWIDGITTGFKSTLAMSSQPTSNPNTTGINADKKIDYNCGDWTVDASKFTLPSTVTFTKI